MQQLAFLLMSHPAKVRKTLHILAGQARLSSDLTASLQRHSSPKCTLGAFFAVSMPL